LLVSELTGFVANSDENHRERKPKTLGPSIWRGSSEQILLKQMGREARKIPAVALVFFLDCSFYRTYQA